MSEIVETYRTAVREYEIAKREASEALTPARKILNQVGTSNLEHFIKANLNVPSDGYPSRFTERDRVDIDKWPDAQTVRSVLERYYIAFKAMKDAWGALDEDGRIGLKTPDQQMSMII